MSVEGLTLEDSWGSVEGLISSLPSPMITQTPLIMARRLATIAKNEINKVILIAPLPQRMIAWDGCNAQSDKRLRRKPEPGELAEYRCASCPERL